MVIQNLEIKKANITDLKIFIDNAGRSLKTFRYFQSRPLKIIENHIITVLLFSENIPVAYGHLEKEGENIWLGIAVSYAYKSNGYGNLILNYLINYAVIHNIKNIKLTVDKDNIVAIKLYEKNGFKFELDLNENSNLMSININKLDIYVSTIAFSKMNIEDIIALAQARNYSLEFSSGLPYIKNIDDIFQNLGIKKLAHNYFPAPENPFVLNLASSNTEIREKSIKHCLHGLKMSAQSNLPFFSAHAGFCIDPSPNELGSKITYDSKFNKKKHLDLFYKSIEEILHFAEKYNLIFLIENNVIAKFNLTSNNANPLLCCSSDEIIKVFEFFNSKHLGLLLDTAHLKVSCNTMNLDLEDEVNKLTPFIKCIHHSDNDGLIDNNTKIDYNYWFLKQLKLFIKIPHVLEVKDQSIESIDKQIKIIQANGH